MNAIDNSEMNDFQTPHQERLDVHKRLVLDNLFVFSDKLQTNTALQLHDAGITFKTI